MKVHCEVYGTGYYTGPIIVENDNSLGKVRVTVKDTMIEVHAKELIKAIENCMND